MTDLEPLLLKEAAERLGTSVQAVRMRAKRGKLASAMVDGKMVVYVPSPRPPSAPAPDLEALADLVADRVAQGVSASLADLIADRVTQRVSASLALPTPPTSDGEKEKLQDEVERLTRVTAAMEARHDELSKERNALSLSRAEYMMKAARPRWHLYFLGVLTALVITAAALWSNVIPTR